ncbi:peptidase [Haloferacaceae archaeon DSL9]
MSLLVTGYEPFGDHDDNPTRRIVRDLDGDRIAGRDVVGAVLPVEFAALRGRLASLLDEHDPDVVIATGLAAGRPAISVERVGINVADAVTTPDNADADPENGTLDADGPDAYLSTLPVDRVAAALLDAGIPARVSNTAGTHLCNGALYTLHALFDERDRDSLGGFLHVPLAPSQAAAKAADEGAVRGGSVRPSLPLALQTRAVRLAFETTLGE